MKVAISFFLVVFMSLGLHAEDGHSLWLRQQDPVPVTVVCQAGSATLDIARRELQMGWQGKANEKVVLTVRPDKRIKGDGYRISGGEIQANTHAGILYGVYDMLRRQRTGMRTGDEIINPSYERRLLNHWDNPDGSVERGYAGLSIFWRKGEDSLTVTATDRQRWQEYARANASVGINGAVLNNVNASPRVLTPAYLNKVQTIADILRPYGVKTYLAVNFASPAVIGGLETSDPLEPQVAAWWKDKVREIYALIPDFGGFLVKANSEGQPGPQNFGRTHADGANMIADALEPFGGIVMWRAFVYNPEEEDRAKQAYAEFMPFDGLFRDNVIIQVKNGPVDFQPREPFSPLFGAMKKTPVMAELQVTQEYLGQSVHLVFLAPMWEEFLQSETFQEGKGSTVARCMDGSLFPQQYTAIAGVANTGLDANWCGHHFAQANWYAFGRMAWDNKISSAQIADEWLRLTFQPVAWKDSAQEAAFSVEWNLNFLEPVKAMMLQSREAAVNYMMPLGLHHLFSADEHYGPGPWWGPEWIRKDWTPPYYHRADIRGIGFDRTQEGSNAVSQYHQPLESLFNSIETCPESYLLWFHHVPWDHRMKSGRTLWDELCVHYDIGVKQVRQFQTVWDNVRPYVDAERFYSVQGKLREQSLNALDWKDGCLLYFQQLSRMPFPKDMELPLNLLEDLIEKDMRIPAPVPVRKTTSDNGDGTYTNPLIASDFPDPDVIRVEDTYYMVTTTMFVFPGVTVLKSNDLVNWEYCSNAVPRFDFDPCYNLDGGNRYGHGQWATSIRYNDGKFFLLFITLNEGGFLCSASQAEGPWKIEKLPAGFYDPGLFFDDDGKIYVAHGYGKISITELDKNFAPASRDSLVYTGTIRGGLEGTHVYKKDGYYYLYCTYGGRDGIQVALRSRNIYGPYEEKIVLRDTIPGVTFGVHQGALLQTPTGEWWTVLFVDSGPLGRFPSLQPVRWEDGWPVAGVDGRGVITYKKPDSGKEYPVKSLPASDEFSETFLGMQWGWNHNPDPEKWSLTQCPGHLRLTTGKIVANLREAPNMLTQRPFAQYNKTLPTIGTVRMDANCMKDGDVAGLAIFQDPYAYIALTQENGIKSLVMVNNGETVASIPSESEIIYLRAVLSNMTGDARFEYSYDNKTFMPLGNNLKMRFSLTIFTGNKFGLFNYATKEPGGYADFDWFRTN